MGMIQVVEHVPYSPAKARVISTETLLGLDFVVAWSKRPGFDRFSLSGAGQLVAEFEGGAWYSIADLSDTHGIELPAWRIPVEVANMESP